MSVIIKVKASNFIGRNGKLINRKSYRRILDSKITLTKAKDRVKSLRQSLEQVRLLTDIDKQGMEYAKLVNKTTNESTPLIKGYLDKTNNKAVNIPVVSNRRYWKIHSHPTERPLSITDVLHGKKKGGTIFAVTKDGSYYRSSRLGDSKLIRDEYARVRDKLVKHRVIDDAVMIQQLWDNAPTSKLNMQAQSVAQHKLLKHLHNKGLIKYRYKLSSSMRDNLDKYKSIMDVEFARFMRYNKKVT